MSDIDDSYDHDDHDSGGIAIDRVDKFRASSCVQGPQVQETSSIRILPSLWTYSNPGLFISLPAV